jgi:UDP-glucose 4-epimerase
VRPELRGRRVLVTGASGFIGWHLTAALADEAAEIHALVRPRTSRERLPPLDLAMHEADLRNRTETAAAVHAAAPHIVFHLAAPSGHPRTPAEREDMLAGTVAGTSNLLEASLPLAPAIVHFGSSLEYGHRPRPIREDDDLQPTTFRGVAKAAAAMLVRRYALETGGRVSIVRPFSVYGPRERTSRLVARAVRAAVEGETLPLVRGPRRDFVYVDDVVDAALRAACAELEPGEVLNVGTGRDTANEELVELLGRIVGADIRVSDDYDRRPWDTERWVADVTKVERLLGWKATHTLEDGLAETVDWYRRSGTEAA